MRRRWQNSPSIPPHPGSAHSPRGGGGWAATAGSPPSCLRRLRHPPGEAAGPWRGESTARDEGEPRGRRVERGREHAQAESRTHLRAGGRPRAALGPGPGGEAATGSGTGAAGTTRRSQRSPCRVVREGPAWGPRLAAQGSCGWRGGVIPGGERGAGSGAAAHSRCGRASGSR